MYEQSEPAKMPRRRRNWLIAGCASVAAAALIGASAAAGGVAVDVGLPATIATVHTGGNGSFGSSVGSSVDGAAGNGSGPVTWGGGTPVGGSSGTQDAYTEASAKQVAGVVNINTVLGYQDGAAAGTGIVLTSDGTVLTNNHVVEGSTALTVTVLATGAVYDAQVVGTAPTLDIAVIKLVDASGLTLANLGSPAATAIGDDVVAVGNAGDADGTAAAAGRITALEQSITASDESGANAEKLSGLIETDAAVLAGDSGGPLYDSSGAVIGIDTAGSSGNAAGATPQSYAVPIDGALAIAQRIVGGEDSDVVHQGLPAFLGVSMASDESSPRRTPAGGVTSASGAATIVGVVEGTPAAALGLAAGDTITAIDGTAIATSADLSTALAGHNAGDSVSVAWTDAAGASQSGQATLIAGPAD